MVLTCAVTILILIDGFLQYNIRKGYYLSKKYVTILILIDGFLQYTYVRTNKALANSHNPYFNRWFSAISSNSVKSLKLVSHNPYFNRWFSAIGQSELYKKDIMVTILILIDGFLQ